MGIQERKEREKNERKALILRCAKELLLEQDGEGVSMIDIAKKAELSKGTLYLYFSTKEELFKEICDEAAIRFIKYFHSRMSLGLSALETIKLLWRCYLDIFGESDDMIIIFNMKHHVVPAFPFIAFEDSQHTALDLKAPFDSPYVFYTMIKDMISQGIGEGTFDPAVNPGTVARTILSLFSYIVESVVKTSQAEKKAQFITSELKQIFEIFLKGIARDGFDRSCLALSGTESWIDDGKVF